LYDGNGEKIYVKVLKTEAERNAYKNPENMTLVINTDYVVIDGTIYHGSEELCSNEGKEIWTYEDERGRRFNLFIVDSYERLQEL
jgi:predicted nucleic acid-binding Zn ribbon protein